MRVPWSNKEWRRVAVYGLGISGRAAAVFLRRRGVEVLAFDRRPLASGELGELAADAGVKLFLGAEPDALPAAVDGVVVSPGVPRDRPLLADARHHGVPVIAEVELAFPFLDGEVVAITGSNGKSTTTAMAGEMLRAGGYRVEVCGNIGSALSERVEGEPGRVFVVELSSFQLETVEHFRPRAAALLNISPDHLDRHGGLESYQAAKARIFRRQQPGDVAILNAGDPLVRPLAVASRRRFFASEGTVCRDLVEDGCHVLGELVVETRPGREPTPLFRASDVPLPGLHNLENAMAAALLARALRVEAAAIAEALRSFGGLPHRLELVRRRAGVAWYDDSKGTNLGATQRSLEGFPVDSVHIILGGQFKGGDFEQLRALAAVKARRAYLIGESAERFAAALAGAVVLESVGTLERAVAAAARRARPGEVVVLSPACASFDQFRDFAHRGREFQRHVNALGAEADAAGSVPEEGGGLGTQARV